MPGVLACHGYVAALVVTASLLGLQVRAEASTSTCTSKNDPEVYDFMQVRQTIREVETEGVASRKAHKAMDLPGQVNLDFKQPVANNIGNLGPLQGGPAELRFQNVGAGVDLVITNTTFYNGKSQNNGKTEKSDLVAINLKCGETADFLFRFVETGTYISKELGYTYLTICDIDQSAHAEDTESIRIEGVDTIIHHTDFEYDNFSTSDTLNVKSSHHGGGCDNPFDISDLKEVTCKGKVVHQAKRCVMIGLKEVTEFTVKLAISGPDLKYGRDFSFGGTAPYFESLVMSAPKAQGIGEIVVGPKGELEPTPATAVDFPPPSPFDEMDEELPPTEAQGASAMDDPHVQNLRGERFAVNKPADYVMIRVPRDQQEPALLDLSAAIRPADGAPCGLYMKVVTLSGEWLGGKAVQVRSLQRNAAGSNSAGNATEWPFSLKVGSNDVWIPFGDFAAGSAGIAALPETVRVVAKQREELGSALESQTFVFSIGPGPSRGNRASVIVHQALHQALNVEISGMNNLGHSSIGGLLGTEEHDQSLEDLTEACMESKAAQRRARVDSSAQRGRSNMMQAPLIAASW